MLAAGSSSASSSATMQNQTIVQCLRRRVVTWSNDSVEHKEKTSSVLNMFAMTGMMRTDLLVTWFRLIMPNYDNLSEALCM